jgi:hypothetical protein
MFAFSPLKPQNFIRSGPEHDGIPVGDEFDTPDFRPKKHD